MTIIQVDSLAKNHARWRWTVAPGRAGIDECSTVWNKLAHTEPSPPTADATWMRCFWDAFGRTDNGLVLHSLYRGDTLAAVLPLERTGRMVRTWSSVTNAHTPFSAFAMNGSIPEVAGHAVEHLLESAGRIDIEKLHVHGAFGGALVEAARSRGHAVEQSERDGDALVELFGPWEDFRRSLSKNLERGTARKLRQLERMGSLEYGAVTSQAELEPILQECFKLEAKGWKGVRGSPMRSRSDTYRFYMSLARASAAAGRFALYYLRHNGALLAFEYCLRAQRRIDMLKLSYDPDWSKQSPGNVLRYLIFREEIDKGQISTYHMGPPSEWKLHWATRVDPLVRLRIYGRSARSRLSYYSGPQLHNFLKRSSLLRRAAACGRKVGWFS